MYKNKYVELSSMPIYTCFEKIYDYIISEIDNTMVWKSKRIAEEVQNDKAFDEAVYIWWERTKNVKLGIISLTIILNENFCYNKNFVLDKRRKQLYAAGKG